MSREIRLTNSDLSTVVDDDMFDELNKWQWYALPAGDTHYAARDVVDEAGNRTVVLMHLQIMYPQKPDLWGAQGGERVTSALSAVKDLIMEVLPTQSARMSVAEIVVAVKDRAGVRLGLKATEAALEELSAATMAAYQRDPGQPPRWFAIRGA